MKNLIFPLYIFGLALAVLIGLLEFSTSSGIILLLVLYSILFLAGNFASGLEMGDGSRLEGVRISRNQRAAVLFASNRAADFSVTRPEDVFIGEKGDRTNYGLCNIDIPNTHEMGSIERPGFISRLLRRPIAVDSHMFLQSIEIQSESAFKDSYVDDSLPLVVFVHGYNVSFEKAALRAAQTSIDLASGEPFCFFSWPSKSAIINYLEDAETITFSIPSFRIFLSSLLKCFPEKEVFVLAHSMGCRLIHYSAGGVLTEENVSRLHFVYAAPDVDVSVFKSQYEDWEYKPLITIYASTDDRALRLSGTIHTGTRLGIVTEGFPFYSHENIDWIQCEVEAGDPLSHSYSFVLPSALGDLRALIYNQHCRRAASRHQLSNKLSPTGESYYLLRRK